MNRLRFLFLFALMMVPLVAGAQQQDARAKNILAAVASKYSTYASFSADVQTAISQTGDGTAQNASGRVQYKGNKYRISLPDVDIFCDGQKIYQYLPEVNEVNVSLVSSSEKSFNVLFSSPMDFFKAYDKHFVSRYVREVSEGGKTYFDLDMIPVSSGDQSLSRISIRISKQQNQVYSMTAFLKNGIQYYVRFQNIVVNVPVMDKEFIFNPSRYPGVEVIDLTF